MFLYILLFGVVVLFAAGCAMRYKFRKRKPWAHAHHLRRQALYLKRGMPTPLANGGYIAAADNGMITSVSNSLLVASILLYHLTGRDVSCQLGLLKCPD